MARSDASLMDILNSFSNVTDSEPQQPPKGYCVLGWHVDDGIGLARDVNFPVPCSQTWSDLVRLAPQTLQRPADVPPSVRE